MAISDSLRDEFNDRVRPIKQKINICFDKEKADLAAVGKNGKSVEDGKIFLCEELIYTATLQMSINAISVEMLDAKNNDSLNDARKSLYKAVIYLEDVVSNYVDCPFSDLDDRLAKIASVPIEKRFYLVKKLGLAIDMLVSAFGENSKWKESFVELRGRHAVVAKNFIDMKQACKDYFDHESPAYETSVLYIRMLRTLLDSCAMGYRDRYELASRRADDMKVAVNLLIANRRIAIALGDNEESEVIRKKALTWRTKMETDIKAGLSK